MINYAYANSDTPHILQNITNWHYDRKLIQNSSLAAQFLKLTSEVGELADSIAKDQSIVDDVGDIIVVLVNLAEQHGLTIQDCLQQAWGDIKDRKGHMSEQGVFVKDGE